MAIKMSKYVDIKSGINNIRAATEKELIARIFTTNEVVAKQEVLEFDNIEDIIKLFGTEADETKIATKYFSFINKYSRSPKKISFARNFAEGFSGYVLGTEQSAPLSAYKGLSGGAGIGLTYGDITGYKAPVSGSDFSSCNSLSDVATLIQGWLRTAFSSNNILQSCTLTYDSEKNVFKFSSGEEDNETMTFEGNISGLLGLTNESNPVKSEGAEESTLEQVFEFSYEQNNNFATFVFLDNTISASNLATLANYVALNYPSEFVDVIPVTSSNYSTIQGAVGNINGVSLELCGTTEDTGKFNFVMPMAITATTDYNKENGTVNYMYTQDNNMSVVVDTDTEAEQYDSTKVNYYGRTQQAGQKLAFYQNGVLQGNYQDQNIYVNEIWLKDALTTKFLNYMLLTSNWYANKSGQAIGQGLIVDIIERAKLNGTITTEKEISDADKVYIYNVTADENAWRQIYQLGYYLITSISKVKINNQDTHQFNYTLLYSKGDSIKKVEGQNILI